jgi:hypothetical protein
MLAVKATYDNGTVKWKRKPRFGGRHNLIVVFEDIGDPVKVGEIAHPAGKGNTSVMPPLPELKGHVPHGWKEAVYGE